MKQIVAALLILACMTALLGCRVGGPGSSLEKPALGPNESSSTVKSKTPSADMFEIQGTIVYKNIEGGFFAIDGDDGSKYDPINLPESFRKDGLKVKVSARLKKDAMSFHMYGTIIEIVNIEVQ